MSKTVTVNRYVYKNILKDSILLSINVENSVIFVISNAYKFCNFCVVVKICSKKIIFFMEVRNQPLLSPQNVEQSQAQC